MSIIIGALMVKNESLCIKKTLISFLPILDKLIVLDTGSSDDTCSIIESIANDFNVKVNIHKIIPDIPFNFSINRNKLLDIVDNEPFGDFTLLIDANDELINPYVLRAFCDNNIDKHDIYLLDMQLNNETKYNVIRLIKHRTKWRYKGAVHEILSSDNNSIPKIKIIGCNYYQDRINDNEKTFNRNFSDKEILMKEFENDPTNSRTCFFLARTCLSLANIDMATKYYNNIKKVISHCDINLSLAYKYFLRRVELGGLHVEEIFSSIMFCGFTAILLKKDWNIVEKYYLDAYDLLPRAEPLYELAKYYFNLKKYNRAYLYTKLMINLPYPDKSNLFIDFVLYNRNRYLFMSTVCYYFFINITNSSYNSNIDLLYEGKECIIKVLPLLNMTETELLLNDLTNYNNLIYKLEINNIKNI